MQGDSGIFPSFLQVPILTPILINTPTVPLKQNILQTNNILPNIPTNSINLNPWITLLINISLYDISIVISFKILYN